MKDRFVYPPIRSIDIRRDLYLTSAGRATYAPGEAYRTFRSLHHASPGDFRRQATRTGAGPPAL